MEDSPFQKAFDYSLKLLAIQKRTVRQLGHKLVEKKFEPTVVQKVLSSLLEKRLLNDEEFAQTYVANQLAQHPYGRLRVARTLKSKGLSEEVVHKAVSEMDSNYEYNAALELAQGKSETLRGIDLGRRRKKIYDFLVRKGFRFDICRDVVSHIR